MLKQTRFFSLFVLVVLLLSGCQMVMPAAVTYQPREIFAWAAGGQDTATIQAFLPATLHIRVGDTVTWKLGGDDLHVVALLGDDGMRPPIAPIDASDPSKGAMVNPAIAFPSRAPGGPVESYDGHTYVGSGLLSHDPSAPDAPPNDSFSVTFTQPGAYVVHCLFHPWHTGAVVVHENTYADAPDQAAIDAQAGAEQAAYMAEIDATREQSSMPTSMPAADGSTIWFVHAGAINQQTGDFHAQAYEYLPKELTIKAGDTVVWTSVEFHTVTFDDVPPAPEAVMPQMVDGAPPMLILNPEVFVPMRPAAVYDPAQYFNSADIGPVAANGPAWALTFTEPGTYPYLCGAHHQMGMEGTIIVEP